jgi:Uma2 family endonuclease
MAETATKLLSITEFLCWDDGSGLRHELVRGVPVAITPPAKSHAQAAQNISGMADTALRARRPCRAVQQGGVAITEGAPGDAFVPDVLVTCEPVDDEHLYEAPILIVEVLSPKTRTYDKKTKVPAYAALPSVEEVWLVESEARWVQVYERTETGWQAGLPLIGQSSFRSRALGTDVALDEIYALTTLA